MEAFLKKREFILFSLFLFVSVFPRPAFCEVNSSLWQTKKSDHFVIYSQNAPEEYINNLIDKAEGYYNSIVDELGYRRFNFWTWDNRCKLYLYNSVEEYLKDTGRRGWSGAMVDVKKRLILTFINQENFFESILPHEMTHIIFREFIGMNKDLPLWFHEGMACSQEKSLLNKRLQYAKNLVKSELYIGLKKFSDITNYNLVVPEVFYAQAASLIIFLMEVEGREKFFDFNRKLKESSSWFEAIREVYKFNDLDDMEKKWKEFITR